MRITRANMADLVNALESLTDAIGDTAESAQSWLDNQDEPKNEYVREDTREAREAVEDALLSIRDAAQDVIAVIEGRT